MVSAANPIRQQGSAAYRRQPDAGNGAINVGRAERLLSVAAGTALALAALRRRRGAVALGTLGASLLLRGTTGHCQLYGALGISTATKHGGATSVAAGAGMKVVRSVTVRRSAGELFRLWRDLASLPQFMTHLVSVKEDGSRSTWTARGPLGSTVSWQAEIINEVPDRLIAWKSVEGSQVDTAGSVHFEALPDYRGTEVRVELKYNPPAGKAGTWVAWLFGKDPDAQVREEMRRFKQLAEGTEIPTSAD